MCGLERSESSHVPWQLTVFLFMTCWCSHGLHPAKQSSLVLAGLGQIEGSPRPGFDQRVERAGRGVTTQGDLQGKGRPSWPSHGGESPSPTPAPERQGENVMRTPVRRHK